MQMQSIPEGRFLMGDPYQEGHPIDRESPPISLFIPTFKIATTPVTNFEFSKFIEATGYITEAERFGWSFVFHLLIPANDTTHYECVPQTPWWKIVPQACWNHPEGTNSHIDERWHHPVVHVSRNDAVAFCQWANKRLPSEAEWEYAARANTTSRYPWGEKLIDDNFHANTWQGTFPNINTLDDGYLGTAPVKSYPPNQFGLYQMIGNVWEWCSNPAFIPLTHFHHKSGQEWWKINQMHSNLRYAIRGGSFLCHSSYCNRHRVSARNADTATSTSSNLSFRCVDLD